MPKRPSPKKLGVRRPLIFISHDTRDRELAAAFENLLLDASGGTLDVFRSSDQVRGSGIAYGAEWYPTTMSKLAEASEVVAILTRNSLASAWVLYEIGVAHGRRQTPMIGVSFGLSRDELRGPFQQLHTSADDEDSLTGVVMQIIRDNTNGAPREDAVRRQVAMFRNHLQAILGRESRDVPSIPAQRRTEGLRNRTSLIPIEVLAAGAMEILASGVTLDSLITPNHDYFEEKLQQGATLRFLIVDRESNAWKAWNDGQKIHTPEDMDRTLRTLTPLLAGVYPGHIEVRLSPFTMPVSLVIVDPNASGRMTVEIAFTGFSITNRPHLHLTKADSPDWFQFFVARFEYLWRLSSPWRP